MREIIVKGFFVCNANGDEFVLTQAELYQLLLYGAHFDHVRPLHQEDFSNPDLFQLHGAKHA